MRFPSVALSLSSLLILAGCAASPAEAFSVGSTDSCDGVSIEVNYGILATDRDGVCIELSGDDAVAIDVLNFAGIDVAGTDTYGDQIICRVNGLPSADEPFVVEGEEPHLETCADMPPAFAYWALWVKDDPQSEWAYAEEGVGTLVLKSGMTVGLVFSTGGDTPFPSDS